MASQRWTKEEDEILIKYIYDEGNVGVAKRVGRTEGGVYVRSKKLGDRVKKKCPIRHDYSKIDDELSRVYNNGIFGGVSKLSRKTGIPEPTLKQRARKLNLPKLICVDRTLYACGKWSKEEDEIIESYGERSTVNIQRILRKAGHARSLNSIADRVSILGVKRGRIDILNATDVSRIIGVGYRTVIGWVDKKLLRASREQMTHKANTSTARYWIKRNDIKKFIITNPTLYDHKKLDWLFVLDLLTGSVGSGIQHSCGHEGEQDYSVV